MNFVFLTLINIFTVFQLFGADKFFEHEETEKRTHQQTTLSQSQKSDLLENDREVLKGQIYERHPVSSKHPKYKRLDSQLTDQEIFNLKPWKYVRDVIMDGQLTEKLIIVYGRDCVLL